MNISEFERVKPRKAYTALERLIKKYTTEPLTEAPGEEDVKRKMTEEVKEDLLKFKHIFLTGE
jgi:hypothetical protein